MSTDLAPFPRGKDLEDKLLEVIARVTAETRDSHHTEQLFQELWDAGSRYAAITVRMNHETCCETGLIKWQPAVWFDLEDGLTRAEQKHIRVARKALEDSGRIETILDQQHKPWFVRLTGAKRQAT